MIELLKDKYWSKADAFLLPLTGLKKNKTFNMSSFLFWDEYNIEDYNLILMFKYKDYAAFLEYCKTEIFPILDKKGYLVENFDCEDVSIFVLDMSEWSMDIEMFMKGKYSKFSNEARVLIESFHTYYLKGGDARIYMHIYIGLYPYGVRPPELTDKDSKPFLIEGLNPIEYVAKNYGLPLDELKKTGELAGIYEIEKETLALNCHVDMT